MLDSHLNCSLKQELICQTEEESMVHPAAQGLRSLPLQSSPHQALRQRDQDVKGSRMSCASYVRKQAPNPSSNHILRKTQSSSENRYRSFSLRFQLRRIRTLSLSLRCALLPQNSHPPIICPEACLHSPRSQTPPTIRHILPEHCPHNAHQVRPVRGP